MANEQPAPEGCPAYPRAAPLRAFVERLAALGMLHAAFAKLPAGAVDSGEGDHG